MKKKILITGANGFIGRYFIENYKGSDQIIGVVKKIEKNHPKKDLLIELDLGKENFVQNLPYDAETIIHMAQSNFYRDFPHGAGDMRLINIDSTFKILDWAKDKNVKNFILLSTANVYGSSNNRLKETNILEPSSFYGVTKLCAEKIALKYNLFFKVHVLRLFTVYGPRQKNMLIPNMIDNIKYGKEITLAKGKGPLFSPIFVSDVVNIINSIINETRNESILCNICGDERLYLKDIVEIISNKLKISTNIKTNSNKVINFSGDNTRLHELIPNLNLTNFAKGIDKVLNKI